MTYVIGIKRFDTTAILVDSALSLRDAAGKLYPHPELEGFKNGVLYPGCIYGFAGNLERAAQFMQKMRTVVATETGLLEKWEALEAAVRIYPFAHGENQQFDALLSSRHSGAPELFVVDSADEELRRVDADMHTLGSGADFLDVQRVLPFARDILAPDQLIAMERAVQPFTRLDYPYMLAFLIHASCYGEDGRQLCQAGVGGIVHFIRQDSCSEERQKPSLYVLASPDPATGGGMLTRRRIALDSHELIPQLLVVGDKHYGEPPDWAVAIGTDIEDTSIPLTTAQAIVNATIDRHQRDRPYYFMGAGVIDMQRDSLPSLCLFYVDDGTPRADMTDYLDPVVDNALAGHMQALLARLSDKS